MDSVRIEVRGVKELAGAFKAVDAGLPLELKRRFKAIAETVASLTRSKMPRISGHAASSIKARATARTASIAFGGFMAEYEPWLDFGGRVGRNRSVDRPRVQGGRYLYPSIAEQGPETAKAAEDAVNDVARRAGFETREGL